MKRLLLLALFITWFVPSVCLSQSFALRFDATKNHHVDHGALWLPGVNYSTFQVDMLVRPMMVSGTGYIGSGGYGGRHNLLLGTTNGAGKFAITGNIWNGTAVVSFSTAPKFFIGKWYYVTVKWDGLEIVTYVNGVVEGRTAYVASTRSTPSGTDSVFYVGGSDHLMGTFDLAWIRIFEGSLPNIGTSYYPYRATRFPLAAHISGSTVVKAQFLADYTQASNVINDLSDGLNGVRHPGIRSRGAGVGTFLGTPTTPILLTTEADLPQWVPAVIEAPNVVETITIPPTAKVSDSFSNREYSPFWSDTDGLGSTEGGTAGIKAWLTSPEMYGISSGSVFPKTTSTTEKAIVETDSQTQDIQINREGERITIVGRYTDANNYVFALYYAAGGISFYNFGKYVAGVGTDYGTVNTAGGADSNVRLVINGTTVQIYSGGVLRNTVTDAKLPTGTKAGFNLATQDLAKVSLFEVY